MYKKLYTLYKEGAIFFNFLVIFFYQPSKCFALRRIVLLLLLFSESWVAEVSETPQCYQKKIFFWTDFVVEFRCCRGNDPSEQYGNPRGTKTKKKKGGDWSVWFATEATTTTTTQPQTFVNCMQKQKKGRLYHYFELVYVKVIFLHVDRCYFVFQGGRKMYVFSFLLKIWKSKNSVC